RGYPGSALRNPTSSASKSQRTALLKGSLIMATVGLIGSGQIGSAIARLAIEAGHQVVLSNSRGPVSLTPQGFSRYMSPGCHFVTARVGGSVRGQIRVNTARHIPWAPRSVSTAWRVAGVDPPRTVE